LDLSKKKTAEVVPKSEEVEVSEINKNAKNKDRVWNLFQNVVSVLI